MLVLVAPPGERHETGGGHPERPQRLEAVQDGIASAGIEELMVEVEARQATDDELTRVHDPAYLRALEQFCAAGGGWLDPDTAAGPGSWRAAKLAAGAGLAAMEALDRGGGEAAFVAARPPGHHALRDRAMGFCLLNNIAVTAATLADRNERVLIVDWDVHHGNGTQAAFWNDQRVLYISIHESPLFPGTGGIEETGGPMAPMLTINVPLPPGATGDVVQSAIEDVAAPAAAQFGPTWVLVSAGFDAHRSDPLAGLALTAADFANLATAVTRLAPRPGRLLLVLEGGYNLSALRDSVGATLAALVGTSYRPEPPSGGGPGMDVVRSVSRYWQQMAEGGTP